MAPSNLTTAMNAALHVYGEHLRGAPVRDLELIDGLECRSSRSGAAKVSAQHGSIVHVQEQRSSSSEPKEYCFLFYARGLLLDMSLPYRVSFSTHMDLRMRAGLRLSNTDQQAA